MYEHSIWRTSDRSIFERDYKRETIGVWTFDLTEVRPVLNVNISKGFRYVETIEENEGISKWINSNDELIYIYLYIKRFNLNERQLSLRNIVRSEI